MRIRLATVGTLALFTAWASGARANGLESPTTSASGRWSGVGGCYSSSVSGADALVLNPAGLGRSSKLELTLNAQPALNTASAPIATPNQSVDAKSQVAPVAELLASYSPIENLGLGAGVNVAGGQGADYGNVAFGPMSAPFSELLGAFEGSLGAGYRLTKNLSIGASWRITYITATIHSALPGPGGIEAVSVSGASGTSFTGFRGGIQYRDDDDRWGVGLNVRSPVTWKIEGDATGTPIGPAGAGPSASLGRFSSSFVFPLQIAAGADVALGSQWRLYGQYSYSQYSANDTQYTTVAGQTNAQHLNWHDRHTVQIGAQYDLTESWALRAGYIFESQVVPASYPSPYGPPATGNTFALGGGVKLGDHFRVDLAALVDPQSATVTSPAPDSGAVPGKYSVTSYVGALTLGYRM